MKINATDFKIVDTTRLWRKDVGKQQPNKPQPRLLKVRFESKEMVGLVARASAHLGQTDNETAKGVRIFKDKSKSERDKRKRLIDLVVSKNEEETNKVEYKWIADYTTKKVIRVKKDNKRQPFRQRKYR
ncbi:hypothetical protein Pcinc_001183 [Petrolisthes cinctipes]|uniref:Uncharacterized protein n=1 Tax=Petrolisthes cinctipes TaxID=88211 RepID=A0AAE1L461_PETCI|nr:hypothetical protein Pcinc_001183 [Petrolisthes cinctipes]